MWEWNSGNHLRGLVSLVWKLASRPSVKALTHMSFHLVCWSHDHVGKRVKIKTKSSHFPSKIHVWWKPKCEMEKRGWIAHRGCNSSRLSHKFFYFLIFFNFYFLSLIKFFLTFFNQWLRLKIAFCNYQSQPSKVIALDLNLGRCGGESKTEKKKKQK